MKLWNLFKKHTAAMTPLETALLGNLRTNPNGWRIEMVNGVLTAHNRELSIIIGVKPSCGVAYSKKLDFGAVFSSAWSTLASSLYFGRLRVETKIEADATEAALKKALNVQ